LLLAIFTWQVLSGVCPCFTAKFLAAQKKEEKKTGKKEKEEKEEEEQEEAAGTAAVKTKHMKKAEAKMGLRKGLRKARRFAGSSESGAGEVDAAVEVAAAAERALVEPGLGMREDPALDLPERRFVSRAGVFTHGWTAVAGAALIATVGVAALNRVVGSFASGAAGAAGRSARRGTGAERIPLIVTGEGLGPSPPAPPPPAPPPPAPELAGEATWQTAAAARYHFGHTYSALPAGPCRLFFFQLFPVGT